MKESLKKADKLKMPKNNQSRGLKILFGVISIAVIVSVVGAIAFFGLRDRKGNINIANADNSLEAFDRFARQSVLDVIESVDVEDFDRDNPVEIFDFESLQVDLEDNSSSTDYIAANQPEEGSTIHQSIDFEYEADTGFQDMKLSLNADIYEVYQGADSALGINDYDDFTEYLNIAQSQTLDPEIFKDTKTKIEGTLQVESDNENLEFDFEIVVIDEKMYATLRNVEYDESILETLGLTDIGIDSIEEGTINIDIVEVFETFGEYSVNSSTSIASPYTNLDPEDIDILLNSYIQDIFSTMDADEEEQFKVMIAVLQNEVSDFVADTEFIIDIEEVDPIREGSGSVCFEGDLNMEDILENGIEMIGKTLGKLADDPAFADQKSDIEESLEQLEKQRGMAESAIELAGVEVKLRSCNLESDKSLTGLGMMFASELSGFQVGGSSFSFDILSVSSDSDKEIQAPEEDGTEVTNEVKDYVIQSTLSNARSTLYGQDVLIELVEEIAKEPSNAGEPTVYYITNPVVINKFYGSNADIGYGDIIVEYSNYVVLYDQYADEILYEGKL